MIFVGLQTLVARPDYTIYVGLKLAVHWLRVSASIADYNMGGY